MLHEKEKQAYECKILYKDEQIAKLRDFIKELENKLKFQNDLSSSFDSKLKIFEERLKHNHNQNEELTRKNEELQAAKKDYHDKMWKTERLSIKNATDAIQFQFMYQQTLKQAKVYEDKWHEAEERIVIKSTEANLNSELTKYRVIHI